MQRIIVIGNSHSIDAFQLLFEVFKSQNPEKEMILGILYYSGCSISKHVRFGQENASVYQYLLNTDGNWITHNNATLKGALQDQPWDLIFLQAAKSDLDDTLNIADRRALEQLVDRYVSTPHEFAWHTSWPSPNDEMFFSEDYVQQPPAGYKDRLVSLYGFNPVNQFTVLTDKAKAHILPDDTYAHKICTGAAVMYAHLGLSISQKVLWRDYTHLDDYGRLVASYAMYTQLTGAPVTEVKVNSVAAKLRQDRAQINGDLTVTEEMKQVILKSANHALEDPWTVPAEQG